MDDLAIIIVSDERGALAASVPEQHLRACGRPQPRRGRGRKRVDGRHPRARGERVPGGARRHMPEPRLLPREQPGMADLQSPLRPLPQPRYRDPVRHLRRSRLVDGRAPDGRPRRRQADRADGKLQPTIRRFPSVTRALGEALWSERWPRRPEWAGERELDPDPVRGGARDRLDVGVLHARPPGGASQRRAPRRALLHVHGGARLVPADTQCRLEDRAPSGR